MPISSGTRFDKYEIISKLGAGGMGEVYLARDTKLDRKIALKILPEEFTRVPGRLSRFEKEAKAASSLNHPNIITIHEIGEFHSRHFIATEYIEGHTVRQLIDMADTSLVSTLDIAIQITSALSAAHEAGIIHRDIKPENIMLRHDGFIKVLDFGLAKLVDNRSSTSDDQSPTVGLLETDPGIVMGTVNYMSPEQVRGLKVDHRSDIFSLGVVLYEFISGRAPFNGLTPPDLMAQILNHEPPPLDSPARNVPPELQRIIHKTLRKDREERYQTVRDLTADLRALKRILENHYQQTHKLRDIAGTVSSGNKSYETAVISPKERIDDLQPDERVLRTTTSAEYLIGEIKRHKLGILLTVIAFVLIMAAAVYIFRGNHEIDSIAVLPFLNLSTDKDAQMLSDAITDSIINDLSRISNLKVKSRGSVLRYKGREVDPGEAARELDVHAILSGRIVQRGTDISVSVALVDANENLHLWGEQYNRKISDLMLIQQEIANDVSEKMRLKLSGDEKRRLEAYRLYQKGRNSWSKRTVSGMLEGIKYFEQATQVDPTFAQAYAGLADCYNLLVNYSAKSPSEAFPKAREAALKALELDDTLAEAHAALAFTHFQWEWNWIEAEQEFRRAIELKNSYAPAHQWLASLLVATGRVDEAVEEARRAQSLQPFALIVRSQIAWINFLARRPEQAIEEARQILEIDPNFFPAHRYVALGLVSLGKYKESLESFEKAASLSPDSTLLKAELGHAYAAAGRRQDAIRILQDLQRQSSTRHISPYLSALIYTGLGDVEKALEYLNKAYDERAERLVYIGTDPRFEKLRSDRRFIQLLGRIGLVT